MAADRYAEEPGTNNSSPYPFLLSAGGGYTMPLSALKGRVRVYQNNRDGTALVLLDQKIEKCSAVKDLSKWYEVQLSPLQDRYFDTANLSLQGRGLASSNSSIGSSMSELQPARSMSSTTMGDLQITAAPTPTNASRASIAVPNVPLFKSGHDVKAEREREQSKPLHVIRHSSSSSGKKLVRSRFVY